MRKLLNTLYIEEPKAYLSLDGNNIVVSVENEERMRVSFDILEAIVCFTYCGCSPALMGKCVELGIPISFISPQGRFQARLCANTRGSVVLRVAQVDCFREWGLRLAKDTVGAKLRNTEDLIKGAMHNKPELRSDAQMTDVLQTISDARQTAALAKDSTRLMGIEGNAAAAYFGILPKLFSVETSFAGRNRRPPLDPVNAALSYTYAILTHEYVSALESVGLDPAIGYYHALHLGRDSLACDMMEEVRCVADRFVLTMFNLRIFAEDDFDIREEQTLLNAQGRKKLLREWQERKRKQMLYSGLREKIPMGLLPYAQSVLMARYVRGELEQYPHFRFRA